MHIKFILPALTEARTIYWRPIKYSLFPPLGLATLAGYLREDDEAEIVDEHVESLNLDDCPDIVAIEVYITSACRAYAIADRYRQRGVHVVLGGLHVTTLPDEASRHADTIVVGPAEEAWPRFLEDFRRGVPRNLYGSRERTLVGMPHIRRDLIKRRNYLAPNSVVVSRGCPHSCDFCYKESFYAGGASFYTAQQDWALDEIANLPGRHLFFLDDNIFAAPQFASDLFREMKGMNRIWQGAATVQSLRNEILLDTAVESGLRSLFIGFESLNQRALEKHGKRHNRTVEYEDLIRRLRGRGVMINASFVFGMDDDDASVFDRTVEWAVKNSIETATFHILTPYPGTALFKRMEADGRIMTKSWDLYDTRHAVFEHPLMDPSELESGYWRAYENFYSWSSILSSALQKETVAAKARHFAYTSAWKKFEALWGFVIRLKKLNVAVPALETVLNSAQRSSRAGHHIQKAGQKLNPRNP